MPYRIETDPDTGERFVSPDGGTSMLVVWKSNVGGDYISDPDYVLQPYDNVELILRRWRAASPEYFPNGRPLPEILTPEEAAIVLRLDTMHAGDMRKALAALNRLVNQRQLEPIIYAGRGGGQRMYPRRELLNFVAKKMGDEAA
jgi:hypothetical protein